MKLAINGGKPVRDREFRSKPFITEEMIEKVASVMREGIISGFRATGESQFGGKYVREFEDKWGALHKVSHSISVNSATSGLIVALRALGIGSGDEVICTPFTFSASWASVQLVGAIPVFADVDLDTFCLDPISVADAITEHTKAIMPVHWNGNAGSLQAIIWIAQAHSLKVIEDAAQTPSILYQNKHLGTHGDIGVVSLNEPKNIMTGEGGIIMTDNKEIARRCRLIRNHGENIDRDIVGYNFKLTELQGALGIMQLDCLEYLNNIRRRNWLYLCDRLKEYEAILKPQLITNRETFCPYTVAFRWLRGDRDEVANKLRAEGIPVATGVNYLPVDLPNASRLQNQEYLGFFQVGWPNTIEDMDDIVKGFGKIIENKHYLSKRCE